MVFEVLELGTWAGGSHIAGPLLCPDLLSFLVNISILVRPLKVISWVKVEMRGKEKEQPHCFTLWFGLWKMLRTDWHINLTSVFPFFCLVKPSWPGSPPCAPRDITQLPVPTHYPAPYPPATARVPAVDMDFFLPWVATASFSTPDFKTSFALSLCLPYSRGTGQRPFLGLYPASCFFSKPRFLGQG